MLLQRLTSPKCVLCWLVITAGTLGIFWRYELAAGAELPTPAEWPAETSLASPGDYGKLLIFVHPQCGCTPAGLHELQEICTGLDNDEKPELTFVLLQPANRDEAWVNTANEKQCRLFPGAQIIQDSGGSEAACFGASTSGTCLLYNAGGQLIFSGGLTQSRGHAGPNRGRDLLTECLVKLAHRNSEPPNTTTSHERRHYVVFGCPLFNTSCQSP